ncbi:MAG: lipoprotein-releasing ABC transporter permease subunit [Thiotrichaceae bacterium]|nr:lipoprotein-releasing ABC transporter permease subunit [Thiotrichaceae bacterium]
MFKPIELYLGLRGIRHTRTKKSAYVSFIALASMTGLTISVMVLITVLSIMNGFEQALRERILGVLSHVTISSNNGQLDNWQAMRETVLQFKGVKGVAPFINNQVMLNVDGEVRGVSLQGVLPSLQKTVGTIEEHMEGSFTDLKAGESHIILGASLAKDLGVVVGDELTAVSMRNFSLESGEMPNLRVFTVVGTFKLDMKLYDSSMAFIHLQDAAEMLEQEGVVSGIRLQMDDMLDAPNFAEIIREVTAPEIWVIDWTQQNENFFKAIQTQKTMFFIILIMLVVVASFNLVSTMVMVVIDKNAYIAILRTLGLSAGGIMRVFLVQGVFVALIGTALGILLGILISLNIEVIVPFIESLLGFPLVSEDAYFISKIKGALQVGDVVLIAGCTFVLALLATMYPSWKASKVQPAEALSYE